MSARPGLRPFLGLAILAMIAAVWFAVPSIAADNVAAAGAAAAEPINMQSGELPRFRELFGFSPIINSIIIGLSVISLLMFVYFLLSIRTGSLAPTALVNDLNKLIVARRFDEATSVCRSHGTVFISSIVQRVVENADKDHNVRMQIIQSEGQRRASLVWNRISLLLDLSSVAPMLGLTGTVLGMLIAFYGMPMQTSGVGSKVVALAIGKAMSTTLFGLVVAIESVIFYSILKARTTSTLAEVEQVVNSLADHVQSPGPANGGNR